MTSRSTLEVPAVQPAAEPPPPRPGRPGGVLVALVAGLALGYLAGAYAAPSLPRATVPTTTVVGAGIQPPVETPPTEPLAERHPATAGKRLLVVSSAERLELLSWSAEARFPRRLELPFQAASTSIDFDVSGSWASFVTTSIFNRALYLANLPNPPGPVFLDASSSRWHPTEAGHLAWTGRDASGLHLLYRSRVTPLAPRSLAEVDPGERLLAWGHWGFLLGVADGCPALRTLSWQGDELARAEGWFVDASADGRLLLVECGQEGMSPLTLTEPRFREARTLAWVPPETFAAHWSPGGRHLAFFVHDGSGTGTRLEVYDVDGRHQQSLPVPRPLSFDWHYRDIIVLAARGGQVVVVDLNRPEVSTIRVEERVLGAFLR